MKIAFIAKAHLDISCALLKELAELVNVEMFFVVAGQCHTESIFELNLTDVPYGLIEDPALIGDLLGRKQTVLFGDKVKIKFFHFPSWKVRSLNNVAYLFSFVRHLRKSHFDIIHFNGTFGLFHIIYFYSLWRSNKVQSIHDPTTHTGEGTIQHEILRRILHFQRKHFIVHSHFSREDLTINWNIHRRFSHVIPFGPLSLHCDNIAVEEKEYNILFFGRISHYKGLNHLLRAFKIVRNRIPDASLVIAGKGDLDVVKNEIGDDASILIDNRYIPKNELLIYLKKCSVVVLPYTEATQSGVVMTAYAENKPVVCSAVGGLPEVVKQGETGFLVPPGDPMALAEALIKILEDTEFRKKMEKNIERICNDEMSWHNAALQTLHVYKCAIKK